MTNEDTDNVDVDDDTDDIDDEDIDDDVDEGDGGTEVLPRSKAREGAGNEMLERGVSDEKHTAVAVVLATADERGLQGNEGRGIKLVKVWNASRAESVFGVAGAETEVGTAAVDAASACFGDIKEKGDACAVAGST